MGYEAPIPDNVIPLHKTKLPPDFDYNELADWSRKMGKEIDLDRIRGELTKILLLGAKSLSSRDKLVVAVLSTRIDMEGYCTTPMSKIMEDTRYSRNTVIRSIKRLEDTGFIRVTRQARKANTYRLPLALVESVSAKECE